MVSTAGATVCGSGPSSYTFLPPSSRRSPALPVLPVTAHGRKLELVRAHAGEDRAIAWIDDRLEPEAFAWADARPGPAVRLGPRSGPGNTKNGRASCWERGEDSG